MKAIFCRGSSFTSALIRAATFSKWAHVAVEVNGFIYDSSAGRGVQRWLPSEFNAMYPVTDTAKFFGSDALALEFLRHQIGKPYDWGAVFALPFRADWEDPNKWFCSELVAAVVAASGSRTFRSYDHRITPRDLWYALAH